MIIPPNTSNQIKIRDEDDDELWLDTFPNGEVVATVHTSEGEYHAVILDRDDVIAAVRHLITQGAVSLGDLTQEV